MADRSAIEWTTATWNPTTGCGRISSGCDNCYALALARRWIGVSVESAEAGLFMAVTFVLTMERRSFRAVALIAFSSREGPRGD